MCWLSRKSYSFLQLEFFCLFIMRNSLQWLERVFSPHVYASISEKVTNSRAPVNFGLFPLNLPLTLNHGQSDFQILTSLRAGSLCQRWSCETRCASSDPKQESHSSQAKGTWGGRLFSSFSSLSAQVQSPMSFKAQNILFIDQAKSCIFGSYVSSLRG